VFCSLYAVPTTLDCELLRDLYGTSELRSIFDSRALVQSWLDVERALAEAEAEVSVIPEWAAKRIAEECEASRFDLAALRDGIEASKHPLVPLLLALGHRCGEAGGYVHWGITTQDVVDTGLVLQARAGLAPIGRDIERSVRAGCELALRGREAPMAGRTHGQHAVPITFGLKAATWADELGRARERLEHAADTALVAQLSGAAGTLAALGDHAEAVQEAFCRRLSLPRPDVHWHATRDRLRDLAHALAEVAAAAERIASEIIRLQSTEISEVFERSTDAHVGSSTMPQKRNPMTSEYIVASARLLRAQTAVLTQSPAHAHERDMGPWAAEWLAVPSAFILCGGVLAKLAAVLEGLEVDEERMRMNLDLTSGRLMAEAVMMALAPELGREPAHELLMAASRRAAAEGRSLGDVLLEEPGASAHLSAEDLEQLLDPIAYFGLATLSVDAVVERYGSSVA
jgi:3-carboxy-cis,cis-muconate cycloisomerase